MPLPTGWHREHHLADGQVVQIAASITDDGGCRAAVYLDEFSNSAAYILGRADDVTTVQVRADALVQKAFPHNCDTNACSEWSLEQPVPASRWHSALSY